MILQEGRYTSSRPPCRLLFPSYGDGSHIITILDQVKFYNNIHPSVRRDFGACDTNIPINGGGVCMLSNFFIKIIQTISQMIVVIVIVN